MDVKFLIVICNFINSVVPVFRFYFILKILNVRQNLVYYLLLTQTAVFYLGPGLRGREHVKRCSPCLY